MERFHSLDDDICNATIYSLIDFKELNTEVGSLAWSLIAMKPLLASTSSTTHHDSIVDQDSIEFFESRQLPRSIYWSCLTGVVLLLLSLAFYVYGGTVACLHKTSAGNEEQRILLVDYGNKVRSNLAITYTPRRLMWNQLATAFPFAFALVVGNTLKQVAAYKLERGVNLRFLEQITRSLSVGSMISTQILPFVLLISWPSSFFLSGIFLLSRVSCVFKSSWLALKLCHV